MSGAAYLCSYIPRDGSNPLGETRIITRGFACKSWELKTELETACHAKRGTLVFERIAPSAVEAWREHYREHGAKIYLNKEGFEQ